MRTTLAINILIMPPDCMQMDAEVLDATGYDSSSFGIALAWTAVPQLKLNNTRAHASLMLWLPWIVSARIDARAPCCRIGA